MQRTIRLEIDQSSWPSPGPPAVPTAFLTAGSSINLNIPTVLLVIGYLTTPTRTTGVALNEYWAWVRYLNATTIDPDIRITDDFAELDSHQKTSLSYDFGMGIPMYWLTQSMQLQAVADGRYFIERVAASVGATAVPTSKRGPNKSPDFVARDTQGVWHIVECKGTQSDDKYRDRQLQRALAQKSTVTFPSGYSGQRLACGVVLGGSEATNGSSLKIIDPPERKQRSLLVSSNQIDEAVDAASRSIVASSLKAAGFYTVASAIASPLGPTPSVRRGATQSTMEQARQAFVEMRAARATSEINDVGKRTAFTANGESYVGREVNFDLPRPVVVDGQEVLSVTIQQGVSRPLVESLRADIASFEAEASATSEAEPKLQARPRPDQKITLSHGDHDAELIISDVFVSRLILHGA